jgi:hypothetical protein
VSWPGSVDRRHGLGTAVHAVPSQCSMSVPGADVPALPAAHALMLENAATDCRDPRVPGVASLVLPAAG